MVTFEIQAALAAIEQDATLYAETGFARRVEAIDDIEFHIIDRIEGLLQTSAAPAGLIRLQQDAGWVRRRLEALNEQLFQRLRAAIRAGEYRGAGLRALAETYVGRDATDSRRTETIGYDVLDVFVNGLLRSEAAPEQTVAREPEMVAYQPTPARIIFELVERAQLTEDDVFYDLGSGLGHVPILVHLLGGAPARGIEVEPAYCAYARVCAAELNLSQVTFVNADARTADYSAGSVFFLYTPFTGSMLHAVLDRLREAAGRRRIRLYTYGPCTPEVARESWLTSGGEAKPYRLGVFSSR